MNPDTAKALAADYETLWREEFAALPDELAGDVRTLFAALDGLNDLTPKDRRRTWVNVNIQAEPGAWRAYATPRVEAGAWNAAQALHLVNALWAFEMNAGGRGWLVEMPTTEELHSMSQRPSDEG